MNNLETIKRLQKIKTEIDEILVIMASASFNSINEKIMKNFLKLMNEKKISLKILNLRNYAKDIPMLLDNYQIPSKIEEIYESINRSKSIIIFAPEHGGHFSAFFKNIIEWIGLKNKDFLTEKKIIVVSASKTLKIKRYMEEGINNTFKVYGGKTNKFINYNNYMENTIQERGG